MFTRDIEKKRKGRGAAAPACPRGSGAPGNDVWLVQNHVSVNFWQVLDTPDICKDNSEIRGSICFCFTGFAVFSISSTFHF